MAGQEHVWFKISINVDQMGCSVKPIMSVLGGNQ